MNNETNNPDKGAGITAICIMIFIALLIVKAGGWYEVPWGVATAPIWGRFSYIIIVEALQLERK